MVGTEQRKKWKQHICTSPKPSELGPITEVSFISTAKRALHGMKLHGRESDVEIITPLNIEPNTTEHYQNVDNTFNPEYEHYRSVDDRFNPDYYGVTLLMDAAGCEQV